MEYIDAKMPRPSARKMPQGSCDTHNHVFGPFDEFPLEHPPDYPIPLAPAATYLQMLDLAGLDRGVLVQPTQQDRELAPMLHALSAAGRRLRAVAAARADVADEELDRMQKAGVVGLRFVEAPLPSGAPRPGAVGFAEIASLAPRMRELDWSINVWGRMVTLMDNLDALLQPGLPVVFEHMGMLDVGEGIDGKNFQMMLSLLREGRIWVKLSVCRCSTQVPGYEDLRPFADALVDANAGQLLWGSDWPFMRMLDKEPDVTDLLDVLLDWVGDTVLQQKILADNPARLYNF